jgi:hypothetical protein
MWNHDSLPDLYFTGNLVHDRLFINEGNMHFKDVTEQAGSSRRTKAGQQVSASSTSTMMVSMIIYVCRSRWKDSLSHLLYVNDGNGHFTEHAKDYGVDASGNYSIMANFFDYDKDGDLDLFLANHPTTGSKKCASTTWKK